MPPVRWKSWITVMVIIALQEKGSSPMAAAQQMQDSFSMSSDGWRPIVGSKRHTNNNNAAFDVVPAEVLSLESSTLPLIQKSTPGQKNVLKKQGVKVKYTQKSPNQYYLPTGPQQTLSPGSQQHKKIKKPTVVQGKTRKQGFRGQALSHSSRNEVFAVAPSNIGGFPSYHKPQQNNIKTREAQGFGLIGNSFGASLNPHIELSRFPLTGENILQRPTYFLAKPLQNDEYSRNLLPPAPPRSRVQQKNNKDTKISLYAFKEGPATDATSNVPQFNARPNQFLPQASPTFEFSTQQQAQRPQSIKEQAVDVQVTKENLKQYTPNGAPVSFEALSPAPQLTGSRNRFPIGFVEYDFQGTPQGRPQGLNAPPNTLTYEVTEGKYLDTPTQRFQFRPQEQLFQFQNLQQPASNARPTLFLQSDVATPRPNVFQAPLVDLSAPGFLPTPYKPENSVIPTSPTESEAATVFNKVSNKMNQYRGHALKDNPLFFDIKEVSTHYPVLGQPELSEGNTQNPQALNQETGEISNEIPTTTTQKERTRRPTKEPSSTRDPTRSRIRSRGKPRTRKPTTTTTTTEEPMQQVETYAPIRSQEEMVNSQEMVTEGERHQRPQTKRRRPKPTAYRPQEGEEDERRQQGSGERPRQRGRYRVRTKDRQNLYQEPNTIQRKRLRPHYTQNLPNSSEKQSWEETTEVSYEQYSYEREPSKEQVYSQETSISNESVNQEEPVQTQMPFIEEIHPATITSTRDRETIINHPENEVDYTTQSHQEETTTTTTSTTTTTTEAPSTTEEPTTSTVKSTRIRRPTKYDSSNRPRFSVKDYRQRLNQYSSTTTPTTTGRSTPATESPRLRFPSRQRTRPALATTASSRVDEEVEEESTTTFRSKFKPKDPRHQTTTESEMDSVTENVVKHNKVRQFKTTTQAPEVTTKVSIRPNLFSARRRAGYPSLKARIQNKQKKNEIEEEEPEAVEGVEPLNVAESATTEQSTSTITITELSTEETQNQNDEEFSYSQRVSDLTSSFKDYDKPGAFNAVAPTSRSIPNYFTLQTDDPILPIEAFFPKLKERGKER
ncbi:mucin-5AC-like [Anthonomus grandis grandis]|uniref:mucin-5AC-like n=1 Tax=Anthonomus grandis grandis TaxID=2921223 RepID=UPI0021652E9A|nr:mucin-5AC-like [Anthonomus grandis grandis]